MPSTVSPMTLCCALSQSMITRVHRSISLCAAFRILDELDHQVGRAAHESGRAQRTARRHHRQDVAVIEDLLPVHADAVQRQRREAVGLDFVLRELVDVFQPIERVILARRVVLPELDLRAEHRGSAAIPYSIHHDGHHDDVRELLHDLQVRLEPELAGPGSSPCA